MAILAHPRSQQYGVTVVSRIDENLKAFEHLVSAPAIIRDETVEHVLVPIILAMCAVGQRCEVPQVRSLELLPR